MERGQGVVRVLKMKLVGFNYLSLYPVHVLISVLALQSFIPPFPGISGDRAHALDSAVF